MTNCLFFSMGSYLVDFENFATLKRTMNGVMLNTFYGTWLAMIVVMVKICLLGSFKLGAVYLGQLTYCLFFPNGNE